VHQFQLASPQTYRLSCSYNKPSILHNIYNKINNIQPDSLDGLQLISLKDRELLDSAYYLTTNINSHNSGSGDDDDVYYYYYYYYYYDKDSCSYSATFIVTLKEKKPRTYWPASIIDRSQSSD
jgi:hypothetical protein